MKMKYVFYEYLSTCKVLYYNERLKHLMMEYNNVWIEKLDLKVVRPEIEYRLNVLDKRIKEYIITLEQSCIP